MSQTVAYLEARYAELEQAAKAATVLFAGEWTVDLVPPRQHIRDSQGIPLASGAISVLEFVALNDPASVLVDIAAKRAILAEHPPMDGWDGDSFHGQICEVCSSTDRDGEPIGDPYPCTTVRLLAQPFRHRPDFPACARIDEPEPS